jgi:hypothetical protein
VGSAYLRPHFPSHMGITKARKMGPSKIAVRYHHFETYVSLRFACAMTKPRPSAPAHIHKMIPILIECSLCAGINRQKV